MRTTLILLALAVALPCAAAEPSKVDEAFGNTIISTYPDGRMAELWLAADGSYTAQGRRHDPSRGHWRVTDGKMCLKQSHPLAFGITYCVPLPAGGLHESWTGKAYTGEAITIHLAQGHVVPGR